MDRLHQQLEEVDALLISQRHALAATQTVKAIEYALRQLIARELPRVSGKVRLRINDIERELGKGDKSYEDFTMGQLVGLLRKSDLVDACKDSPTGEMSLIRLINLDAIVDLRNRLIHQSVEPTAREAAHLRETLRTLMDAFGLGAALQRQVHSSASREPMDVARAAQSSAFRYYPNRRAIVDLSERMANARREICVLQTNVTTLLEYVHCFRTAQAARPELRIRVLTLDPVSKFVQSRGRLFSADDYKVFRDESKANLSSFRMRLGQSKVDCELRLYDEMPTFLMFKIDSAIVLCFITAVGLGRDHVHFEITDDAPGATETFMSHFEVLWERAAAAPG